MFGQRGHQSFQGRTIGKAPRPGQSAHEEAAALADQLDVCLGGQRSIRHDDDHMRPSRAAKAHQYPAKPRVFGVLLGIIFPAYMFDIYRDAVMAPLEHEPHEVQAKDMRAICVEAVRLGQRMLLGGCVFQRAIDYPRAHHSDAAQPRFREGTLREILSDAVLAKTPRE